MTVRDQKGLTSGLLFIGLGASASIVAMAWRIGTPSQMGPGFFPLVLGLILVGLGISVALRAIRSGDAKPLERPDLRAMAMIAGPILLFGAGLQWLGLIVSALLLVILVRLAERERHWRETLALAGVLALVVYAVFVWGLGLRFPIWPAL